MPNGNAKQRKLSKPAGTNPAPPNGGSGNGGAKAKAELKELRKQVKQLQARRSDGSAVAHAAVRAAIYEQFKAVLAAQLDPYNSDPVRLSENTGRPTAVNKLFRIEPAGSTPITASGTVLAANCGAAVLFRDPRIASIKYEVRLSNSRTYTAQFVNAGGLSYAGTGPGVGSYLQPVGFNFTSGTWRAHGDRVAMLRDIEGVDRFWVDVEPSGSSTTVFTFTGLAATATVNVVMTRELRGVITETSVALSTNGFGVATWTVPAGQSGRYAILFETDCTARTNVGFTVATSCPHAFCQRMLPELENQAADVDGMRINSASILYSDRSAELYAQGSIVTCQISGDEDWAQHVGLEQTVGNAVNNYSVVAAYNIAKKGVYKHGRYNFLKLSGIKDIEMNDICEGDGANRYFAPVEYMQMRDYIVVLFDAGNATSLIGEWTFSWHTEIETESQWREIKVPSLHPDVFKDVLYVVGQASQDYENPKHLKAVWNFVKKAAGVLSTVAGAVAPALPPQIAVPTMIGAGVAGAVSRM